MVTISAHSASAISHVCVFPHYPPNHHPHLRTSQPLSDHQPQLCSSSFISHSKHINHRSLIPKSVASAAAKTTKPARLFKSSPAIFPPTTRIPQPSSHYPPAPHSHTPPALHNHHPTTIIPQPSSHNHHPTTIPQPQISPPAPKAALTTHNPPSTFHHLSPPLTSPTSPSLTSPHLFPPLFATPSILPSTANLTCPSP